jgi:hypothetical protein
MLHALWRIAWYLAGVAVTAALVRLGALYLAH